MIKRCPKCGGENFVVTAHVTQEWLVNENGDFIEERSSCEEVIHKPDDDDIWQCDKCGYNAAGSEFNVEERDPQISKLLDVAEYAFARAGFDIAYIGDNYLLVRDSMKDETFRVEITEYAD